MAVFETWYKQDLQEAVKVRYLDGNMFSNNGNGNRIGVELFDGGEALSSITGTVSGYVVTADGATVPCTGSKSGNKASVLIPPAAYQPGNVFISIFLTDGTTVTTLAAISASVMRTRTNAQVDPGSVVTDWTQMINDAMQEVEAAAENFGGIVAVPYASITFPVPLGKYTYYNGNLYRCISPISSSESFTAGHWTQVRLGDDVSDLKSALISNKYNYDVETISSNSDLDDFLTPGNYKVTNGTVAATLSNLPEAGKPGRLTVCSVHTGDYIMQFYVTNEGHVYTRLHTTSFTGWVTKTPTEMITDDYDPTNVYYPKELAVYNGKLYSRRTISGSPESSFVSTRWDEVSIADLYYDLNASILRDSNNILFNNKCSRLNYAYKTSFSSADGYIVFIVPVSSGSTYYSNKRMRYVSKNGTSLAENVAQYTALETVDLYVTFEIDKTDPYYFLSTTSDFTNIIPYGIYKKDNFSRLQPVIDERNLLNKSTFYKRNYGYNGSGGGEAASTSYTYFILPVVNGTTYYIYNARMLSKKSSVISSQEVNNYAYTANYTGSLYITFYNNKPWIVSLEQDQSGIAPYNYPSMTELSVLQTTGSDTRRPMSQKAVTDAINEISQEGSIYAALLPILADKKILQFGDSGMAGDGNNGKGIGEILAEKYGMPSVSDYAVGGSTMGTYEGQSTNKHIINRVNQAISAGIQPDIILVDGGGNDLTSYDSNSDPNCALGEISGVYTEPSASDNFSNGYESVAYKIKTTWPEAMVIYFRIHNLYHSRGGRPYERQISYGEQGIKISEKWAIGVIDMFKRLNGQLQYYRDHYIPDGTHPDQAGYDRFYIPALEQYLYEHRNEFVEEEET